MNRSFAVLTIFCFTVRMADQSSRRSFVRISFTRPWIGPEFRWKAGRRGLHLFRHTAGSLLNKKTADLKRVQVQLGHADIGTTADVYTHVDLETVHQNAADLESVFLEACGGFGLILCCS